MEVDTDDISNMLLLWGRVKMPVSVPGYWISLISDFANVVGEMLDSTILGKATLRITHLKTRLHFDVESSVNLGPNTDGTLKALAHVFGELSDYVAQASAGPMNAGTSDNCQVFHLKINAAGAASCRSSESAERMKNTLTRLKASGLFRPIQKPSKNWPEKVSKLETEFPNFAHVVQTIIAPHLAIIDKGGHHRQSPILLVGEPGIGKTYFAHAVAKVMGLNAALFVNMAEETNGASLAGSSAFWSNSAPGKLFEFMAWCDGLGSPAANPLVILDEIDKCSADRYDPLAALYGLLEAETAARFQDQALPDITMDVSKARFICTANDSSRIPEPLLSRMTVFRVEKPSVDQLRGVIRSMFRDLAEGVRLGMHTILPDEIVEAALHMSPRESKVRLECALASAVRSDRSFVTRDDWPDLQTVAQRRNRIGFLT